VAAGSGHLDSLDSAGRLVALQLLGLISAVANGGRLYLPQVAEKVEDVLKRSRIEKQILLFSTPREQAARPPSAKWLN
jgi:cell division protein FtsI/penicillin-binding protein 2